MLNNSGIYRILNIATGHFYIGSAAILRKRRDVHLHHLRANRHNNIKLQRAYNKHGEKSFKFEVLLICAKSDTLFYEQICMDNFKPVYNLWLQAASGLGTHMSEATKQKLREKRKGFKHSPEALLKISLSGKGRVSANKGKTLSPEVRAKISASRKGKGGGKPLSQETKKKIGAANKLNSLGHRASVETKAKMSAAQKAAWGRRRNGN